MHEEQRLLAQLKSTELLIRDDLVGVKEGLRPVRNVVKTVSKFTTRVKTGAFANFSLDFGIDLLIRRVLLARAGWFTKILIPYLLKNYSSHIISHKHKVKLLRKLNALFAKLRPKPNEAAAASAAQAGATQQAYE